MLTALMTGKALTASELAAEAGVTIQTASSHLAKLSEGGLLRPRKQGRHKYFALANDDVAQALESLMGLAASVGAPRVRTGPNDAALREARVCYNHLAGDMGTRMFDSLVRQQHLDLNGEELDLTASGEEFVARLGIDLEPLRAGRSPVCRECLDWSERRSHLAGSLGRALLAHFEMKKWAKRNTKTRVVTFSEQGREEFSKLFP